MTLIYNWQLAVKHFWSFRLAILSAILGGAEVFVQVFQPAVPSGWFAGAAALISVASAISRIVAQPKAYQP